MTTETLTRHRVADKLPDDDMTVLLNRDGETWVGYLEGEDWLGQDGFYCEAPLFWSHMPEGPGK